MWDFVLLSVWEGKRSRCLFLCSCELFQWLGRFGTVIEMENAVNPSSLSFTACFPQIPCNHGSVIKRSDFLFCATSHFQQRRSLTKGGTNVRQYQDGSVTSGFEWQSV